MHAFYQLFLLYHETVEILCTASIESERIFVMWVGGGTTIYHPTLFIGILLLPTAGPVFRVVWVELVRLGILITAAINSTFPFGI